MYKPSIQTLALLVGAALAWPGVSQANPSKVAKYSIGGDGGTDYLTPSRARDACSSRAART